MCHGANHVQRKAGRGFPWFLMGEAHMCASVWHTRRESDVTVGIARRGAGFRRFLNEARIAVYAGAAQAERLRWRGVAVGGCPEGAHPLHPEGCEGCVYEIFVPT